MENEVNDLLVYALFIGVPILSIIWFIVSLILYRTAKKNSQKKSDYQVMMVISGILTVLLVGFSATVLIAALVAMQQ